MVACLTHGDGVGGRGGWGAGRRGWVGRGVGGAKHQARRGDGWIQDCGGLSNTEEMLERGADE